MVGGVSTKMQRVDPILAGARGSEKNFFQVVGILGD
jgi:hypothetical protein